MVGAVLVAVVAAIHIYIAWLEMVQWEAPRTRRIFGMSAELATETKVMALNQGLYNLFLAVGLIVGLVAGSTLMVLFLLVCVGVAGVVALLCGLHRAFIFQTVPATAALLAVWLL